MVHVPSPLDLNHSHVAARFNVAEDLEIGDDLGAYLVPASLHHPFLEAFVRAPRLLIILGDGRRILPDKPANAPVIIDSEKNTSALQIGERYKLFRQLVVLDFVSLEIYAGVLAVRDQLAQLRCRHRHTLEAVLAASPLECILAALEQLLDQLPHRPGIDGTHVLRDGSRAP